MAGHFCVNCGAPLITKLIEGREHEVCPNDSFVLWHDPKVATAVVVEIGARIELTQLIGTYHVPKTTASSIIGIAYRGRLVDGETMSAGPEMLEVRVFTPDALPQIAFPSHQEVLARYAGEHGRSASSPSLEQAPSPLPRTP